MPSLKLILCKFLNKVLQQSKIQVFFVGVMIGLIASWLYLLAGGQTWLFVPLWAEIVFYPGFFVGGYSYNLFGNEPLAVLLGTIAVGLFYGTVFVIILSLGRFLRHKKKYVVVLLCIATVVVGILFLKKFFLSSDKILINSIRQEFTLSITSDPPGARVYPARTWGQPDSIGTTPFELKGSYTADKDGSGWWPWANGIQLEPDEEGVNIRLEDYVVAKNGYICQELAPVLATIPGWKTHPGKMPSELKYHVKLISEDSSHVNKIGTAVIVNGSFVEVNPPSLKLTEGIYMVDIKSAKPGFPK